MSYVKNGIIEATDYNNLVGTIEGNGANKLNTVWAIGHGDAGYGQPEVASIPMNSEQTAEVEITGLKVLQSGNGQDGVDAYVTVNDRNAVVKVGVFCKNTTAIDTVDSWVDNIHNYKKLQPLPFNTVNTPIFINAFNDTLFYVNRYVSQTSVSSNGAVRQSTKSFSYSINFVGNALPIAKLGSKWTHHAIPTLPDYSSTLFNDYGKPDPNLTYYGHYSCAVYGGGKIVVMPEGGGIYKESKVLESGNVVEIYHHAVENVKPTYSYASSKPEQFNKTALVTVDGTVPGTTWQTSVLPFPAHVHSIAYGSSLWVALIGGTRTVVKSGNPSLSAEQTDPNVRALVSLNGITWKVISLPTVPNWTSAYVYASSFDRMWVSVAYGNRKFIACDYYGNILVSSGTIGDGTTLTWTVKQVEYFGGTRTIAFLSSFFILYGHSYNTGTNFSARTSTDGNVWTGITNSNPTEGDGFYIVDIIDGGPTYAIGMGYIGGNRYIIIIDYATPTKFRRIPFTYAFNEGYNPKIAKYGADNVYCITESGYYQIIKLNSTATAIEEDFKYDSKTFGRLSFFDAVTKKQVLNTYIKEIYDTYVPNNGAGSPGTEASMPYPYPSKYIITTYANGADMPAANSKQYMIMHYSPSTDIEIFGSSGYSGIAGLQSVTMGEKIHNLEWNKLITTTAAAGLHQNTTLATISPTVIGNRIKHEASLISNVTSVYNNRLSAKSQGSTFDYPIGAGTWNSNGYLFQYTVTFESADAARYFFNAGGQFAISCANVTNNSQINIMFQNTCVQLGTIYLSSPSSGSINLSGKSFKGVTKVGGSSIYEPPHTFIQENMGYYGLPVTPTEYGNKIAKQRATNGPTGFDANSNILVWAKTNGPQGTHGDNGSIITISIVWSQLSDSDITVTYPVTGANTNLKIIQPSTLHLLNTWGQITVTTATGSCPFMQ